MKEVSNEEYPADNLLHVSNLGVVFGLGSRWTFSNGMIFGVDWFNMDFPVYQLDDNSDFLDSIPGEEDRDNAENIVRILKHYPRLGFLHFQFGFSF